MASRQGFLTLKDVQMFAARLAKAYITMIALITVPPKKAMFGFRFNH